MSDYPIVEFSNASAWRQWLDTHHSDTTGVWLRLYKKASGVASVTYAEALDDALCYGWIDGQKQRGDELSYLHKFTPRRARSLWSKRNIDHVARLLDAGRMMPTGLAEVERAKADGRWDAAYDAQSDMTVPDDFLTELQKRPKAAQFFATLNKTNRYAIAWRLQTAKSDATRQRRQEKLIALLDAGEKLH